MADAEYVLEISGYDKDSPAVVDAVPKLVEFTGMTPAEVRYALANCESVNFTIRDNEATGFRACKGFQELRSYGLRVRGYFRRKG
jgi:hypothetical protein